MNRMISEANALLSKKSSTDLIQFIENLNNYIEYSTAPSIIAFLSKLFSAEIDIPNDKRSNFEIKIKQIVEELKKIVPKELHSHIEYKIKFSSSEEIKQRKLIDRLKDLVFETLAKKTQGEIENGITKIFNHSEIKLNSLSTHYLFNYINRMQSIQLLEELAFLAPEDEANEILDYFLTIQENSFISENIAIFFLFLKASNPECYSAVQSSIMSQKHYFKTIFIANLPDIEIQPIIENTRDYNFEVVASLFPSRPSVIKSVIEGIKNGTLLMPRLAFLKKLVEYEIYFSEYISEIELEEQEINSICFESCAFREKYFKKIDSEAKMMAFAQTIADLPDLTILEFVKSHSSEKNITSLIDCLTKRMRFSGELKEYFLENYSKTERFFHQFISYFEIEEVEALMKKFYTPVISLESLFKKYYPQELLMEIHKFEDVTLTWKLLHEAVEYDRFIDADFAFLMKSLEGMPVLSKIGTCYEILRSKPNLRKQAIFFFQRSFDDRILDRPEIMEKFGQCAKILDREMIPFLENLSRESVTAIFKSSEPTKEIMRKYMFEDLKPWLRWIRGYLKNY